MAALTEPRWARTASRRLDAMAVDLTQQRAVSLCPTPTAHRRVEVVDADANSGYAKACAVSRVPDDDDTDAGQEPHRGMPPMPMPMLARCHIDGSRRRWCQRLPCQSMRRVEGSAPDDADTDAGQVPHRGTPPMLLPMAMLAMCRIDGRRRSRRDDDDVDDQHESGSFFTWRPWASLGARFSCHPPAHRRTTGRR